MTEWDRGVDRNRDVLERIVALLVALADMADLASGLPFLRRRRLLAILGWGEAEARAFVIDMAPGAPSQPEEPEVAGDAARLAASLRALALVLYAMLRRRSAVPGAIGPRAGQGKPARQVGLHAIVPAPTRLDPALRHARVGLPCLETTFQNLAHEPLRRREYAIAPVSLSWVEQSHMALGVGERPERTRRLPRACPEDLLPWRKFMQVLQWDVRSLATIDDGAADPRDKARG
jgi:hypothetical protein